MNEERVRQSLQRAVAHGELDAERRAWAVVRAAYEQAGVRPERRSPARPLLALAAALAVIAAALTPPGAAVTDWIRERVSDDDARRPVLASLPAPGRLLVTSAEGAWVVDANGTKRLLGPYSDAAWSPQGLHVVAARGPRLVAMTPAGKIRWTLSRPRVSDPRWSPSGFRIAYGSGGSLRVVSGDGAPDRLLARSVVPGAWAWQANTKAHVLAYVGKGGAIRVVDADTGAVRWTDHSAEQRAEEVAWSADGRRLVARAPHALYVFDASGRLVTSVPPAPPEATRSLDVAFAPRGDLFAVASQDPAGRSRVVLLHAQRRIAPRVVFRGAGRFGDLAWSPDGRWLLVTWPSADEWVFVRIPGVRGVVTAASVSREFDPAGRGRARFPRVAGWCCGG